MLINIYVHENITKNLLEKGASVYYIIISLYLSYENSWAIWKVTISVKFTIHTSCIILIIEMTNERLFL